MKSLGITPEQVIAGVLETAIVSRGPLIRSDVSEIADLIVKSLRRSKAAQQRTAPPSPERPDESPEDCLSLEAEEAVEQAEHIIEMCDDVPDAGLEFAMSVAEKCTDIAEAIERMGKVTAAMQTALDNMEAGVSKWLH